MDLGKSKAACSPSGKKVTGKQMLLVAPSGYRFNVTMNINPTKFTSGTVASMLAFW